MVASLGAQGNGGSDPEKHTHADGNVEQGINGTVASKTASKPEEATTNPTSNNAFGDEDDEYISGFKLYIALFSIVSVFFLVLLDFSITATVSTEGPFQSPCTNGNTEYTLPRYLTASVPCCFRNTGYPIYYK